MPANWFYEGVFHSVVEHGRDVFVSVVLIGVRMSGPLTSGGWRAPGHCPAAAVWTPWHLPSACEGTVAVGGVGTRGFIPAAQRAGRRVCIRVSCFLQDQRSVQPESALYLLEKRRTCHTEKEWCKPGI